MIEQARTSSEDRKYQPCYKESNTFFIEKPLVNNLSEVVAEFFPSHKQKQEEEKKNYEESLEKTSVRSRYDFLCSLMARNIWLPTMKRITYQTIIIFDYDDTLFCTSFVQPPKLRGQEAALSSLDRSNIAQMGEKVVKLLELAISLGSTYIITNSVRGWVESSIKKYIPVVEKCLEKIKIISARTEFRSFFPNNMDQWKIQAFFCARDEALLGLTTNIIAVSDSEKDISPAHTLATAFTNSLVKTIKVREAPSPKELGKQLDLLRHKLSEVCASPKNLSITLSRKS